MSEQTPPESHDQAPPEPPEQLPPEWQGEVTECFKTTAPKVYGALLRLTRGDTGLAWVMVQEAFREATRKWDELRAGPDELRTAWLIQVGVYSAIDYFRHAETERRFRPLVWKHHEPAEINVHEEVMTAMAVEHFIKVLKEMPPQRAVVAFLYWRCEWKNSEIAEALGITPGRVSQQVAKAKETLRSELSPYVPFGPGEPEGGARS